MQAYVEAIFKIIKNKSKIEQKTTIAFDKLSKIYDIKNNIRHYLSLYGYLFS